MDKDFKLVKYRVWHSPTGEKSDCFYTRVKDISEGYLIMKVLATYDLFKFLNNFQKHYRTSSGFEYFDLNEKKWVEWKDENGLNIEEHFENLKEDEYR